MKDAYYFPHDSNARNDMKILAMRKDYGAKGYGWFWMCIEIMREQSDYMFTVDDCLFSTLAMQLNVSSKAIETFITDCINKYKLFIRNNGNIYSPALLNRMNEIDAKREKARQSANKRWNKEEIELESDTNANALQTDSDSNASKVKESKVKESKPLLGGSLTPEEKKRYKQGMDIERKYNDEIKKPLLLERMAKECYKTWFDYGEPCKKQDKPECKLCLPIQAEMKLELNKLNKVPDTYAQCENFIQRNCHIKDHGTTNNRKYDFCWTCAWDKTWGEAAGKWGNYIIDIKYKKGN